MNTLHPDTIEAFHEALAQHPAAMADFYKDNCPGCKMLDASLAKLTAPEFEGLVLIKAKLEVLGEDFFKGLGLRQTPSLIAYRDGAEVARLPGFQPPKTLEAWVHKHLLQGL